MSGRGADLIAGISVAGLMLPEAVAYAAIAGFAPQHAIFAAIIGGFVYTLVGTSRFAIVAPTSSSAAMLAAAIGGLGATVEAPEVLATLIVALTGAIFVAAGYLRLGSLSGFIARPVLRGFAFGLAITIIVKQLPIICGIKIHASDVAQLLLMLGQRVEDINLASFVIGIVALGALLFFKRIKRVTGAIIVLTCGIILSYVVDMQALHVTQVGHIAVQLSLPQRTDISIMMWSRLAQLALPLTLIIFAESWGTMRTLALAAGDTINADRELKALGLANIAVACIQGMPVGAGFSASAANASAGTTSRWAAAIAALGLGALLWFAGDLVARLPEPILAAIVISALMHALSPAPLRHLWQLDRDQWVAVTAAVAVIVLGVLNGMLAAIALSLFALLRRLSAPSISQLGQLDGGHDYVDLTVHPDAHSLPSIAIFRPNAPLFFANAERIFGMIEVMIGQSLPKHVIISLEESDDFDSSSLESMIEFAESLAKQAIILRLARVHDRVRDLLIIAGQNALATSASFSVADAVAVIEGEHHAQYD